MSAKQPSYGSILCVLVLAELLASQKLDWEKARLETSVLRIVVVDEVEAGLATLVRRISQIPMVLMSPNTSKLVLQSQSLESHAGPSQLLSKSSLTI